MRIQSFLLLPLIAVLGTFGCGSAFDFATEEAVEESTGVDTNEDNQADVELTFAEAATAPDPSVGDGFTASNGDRVILQGQQIWFTSYNGTDEDYPQFNGYIYDEIEVGKTIPLDEDAQNDQQGGVVMFMVDDETGWIARKGSVVVEQASPLKLKFQNVVMTPWVNTLGEFTVSGSGTW